MQYAVPLAPSPFGRFARLGKIHRQQALGLGSKPRKGFILAPIPQRRRFFDPLWRGTCDVPRLLCCRQAKSENVASPPRAGGGTSAAGAEQARGATPLATLLIKIYLPFNIPYPPYV